MSKSTPKVAAFSFGELANKKHDSGNNNDNDNNSDNNSDSNSVSIKELLGDAPEKKVFIGIYFEQDIADVMRKVVNQKGDQSKLVNEAVRRLFQSAGLML